ncbi:MAG: hypothetical protein ACK5V9_03820 [Burkholderiales bacterium]
MLHEKRINKRFSIYFSGVPRTRRTHIVSGFVNASDNAKLGAVDPNCKVDLAKNWFSSHLALVPAAEAATQKATALALTTA